AKRPVFRGVEAAPDILCLAAKAGNIYADSGGRAARRTQAAVERVAGQRQAEDRLYPVADGVAKIAPRQPRFAGRHTVAVEVGEIAAFVEGDFLVSERVTRHGSYILGQRYAGAQGNAGRRRFVRRSIAVVI